MLLHKTGDLMQSITQHQFKKLVKRIKYHSTFNTKQKEECLQILALCQSTGVRAGTLHLMTIGNLRDAVKSGKLVINGKAPAIHLQPAARTVINKYFKEMLENGDDDVVFSKNAIRLLNNTIKAVFGRLFVIASLRKGFIDRQIIKNSL
jgi:hypothetical protein